ncbi:ABC transporter permease [Rhodobacteraceae bacterium]|nr:ABC transporter permease [Paracoccaceae bacterium]
MIDETASTTDDTQRDASIGYRDIIRALVRDPLVLVSVIFLTLLILSAIFAEIVAPMDPLIPNIFASRLPPLSYATGLDGTEQLHLLGTDALGRDMLSRLIFGARASLFVALVSVFVSGVLGTCLGVIAGYYGGWVETVVMRAVDAFMAVPSLLIALFVLFIIGGGLVNMILIFALVRWVVYARLARGITLSLRETQFVEAARAIGASNARIMLRHILPNMISPLLVLATLEIALLVLAEAGLSFLGFGLVPPEPSWGLMISRGREYMREAWWMITLPGLAIFLTTLSLNLIANWFRAVMDPVQRWRWLM